MGKIFTYIQYFFFLGINWNWKIAVHILSNEIEGEKKYGINTTGSDELKKTKASGVDISHATLYMPSNYPLLEEVLAHLPEGRNHFIDIGCGKGRALCVAAHIGFKKVTGVDFSASLCAKAVENLQTIQQQFPGLIFSVVTENAALLEIPADADCIFFFNPFDEFMMKAVAKNIGTSYNKNPRQIQVAYLNPLYKQIFLDMGFKEIFHTVRMTYMEAVILQLSTLTA